MADQAPLIDSEKTRDAAAASGHFNQGRAAETKGNRWSAIEAYERAFELDPEHPEVCFRLAYNLDLVGEESEALHLYEQCCEHQPAHVNALMNLAVLYEDMGDVIKAEKCLRQVLDTDPNHRRARLYIKDVMASRQMYFDDDQERVRDKQSTLLETPVTDFELSVRSRNCLKKMNIRTLGDLLRVTEAELLASKNFGETSLQEIKIMLTSKNLHLGQALEQQHSAAKDEAYEQLKESGNEALVGKSVGEMNLSVRSRKALSLLNINTVGDLISHTEAELLGIKNFGATSLQEIKEKLVEMGLSLRLLEE